MRKSVSIRLADDEFFQILTMQEPQEREIRISSAEDGQTSLEVEIFAVSSDGEGAAEFLQKLELDGLRPHQKNSHGVVFKAKSDESGKVVASLFDEETGHEASATFFVPEDGFQEELIAPAALSVDEGEIERHEGQPETAVVRPVEKEPTAIPLIVASVATILMCGFMCLAFGFYRIGAAKKAAETIEPHEPAEKVDEDEIGEADYFSSGELLAMAEEGTAFEVHALMRKMRPSDGEFSFRGGGDFETANDEKPENVFDAEEEDFSDEKSVKNVQELFSQIEGENDAARGDEGESAADEAEKLADDGDEKLRVDFAYSPENDIFLRQRPLADGGSKKAAEISAADDAASEQDAEIVAKNALVAERGESADSQTPDATIAGDDAAEGDEADSLLEPPAVNERPLLSFADSRISQEAAARESAMPTNQNVSLIPMSEMKAKEGEIVVLSGLVMSPEAPKKNNAMTPSVQYRSELGDEMWDLVASHYGNLAMLRKLSSFNQLESGEFIMPGRWIVLPAD